MTAGPGCAAQLDLTQCVCSPECGYLGGLPRLVRPRPVALVRHSRPGVDREGVEWASVPPSTSRLRVVACCSAWVASPRRESLLFDRPCFSQVGSRLGVLWAAVWAIPEVRLQQWVLLRLPLSVPLAGQETPVVLALGVSSMFIAWSLSEIIRYSFYFCKVRVCGGSVWD